MALHNVHGIGIASAVSNRNNFCFYGPLGQHFFSLIHLAKAGWLKKRMVWVRPWIEVVWHVVLLALKCFAPSYKRSFAQ
jgi:hypothetical protein